MGADGINSPVRAQLFASSPEIRPEHISMGVAVGELTATPEQYKRWMQLATSFFPVLADGRRIVIALKEMAADLSSAQYYWLFNWDDENAVNEDYWTRTATKQELHCFVMDNLDGLPRSITEIIQATAVEGMVHPPLQLKQMVPPQIPQGRITLLGDAVHPMTPLRGQGANMAMSDGLSIAASLARKPGRSMAACFEEYEAEMRPRGTKSVLESSDGRSTS